MEYSEKIVPLNIVMTYPVHWNKYKVFRDFQQNFYDAVGYEKWKDCFKYDYHDKLLQMWTDGVVFSYEWLMHIGASTKTESSINSAGYYGEGFKIASLCAVRDFGWQVEMSSARWNLEVIRISQMIDDRNVDMMAYKIHNTEYIEKSVLKLFPIEPNEMALFEEVILSFYYYGNPLLGEKLWEGQEGAVYLCNKDAYAASLPYTDDFKRQGAVFCSYQLLGSNPFGLVVCHHRFKRDDRDRKALYSFNIVDVFESISRYISPDGAFRMLEKMRRYWNSVPKKRFDIHSWRNTIYNLIRKISSSTEIADKFRKKYPNLLCLSPVFSIRDRNRRGQARTWLALQEGKYLLVQSDFGRLGYPTLEEICEQNGGFVRNDKPDEKENQCFALLEEFVREVFPEFFPFDEGFPERRIIQNKRASYHGMATLFKKKKVSVNKQGITIRYDVSEIYLKRIIFREEKFYDALSTYIHEFCHCFGGDSSNSFSLGLTRAMEILLSRYKLVEQYKEKWEQLFQRI